MSPGRRRGGGPPSGDPFPGFTDVVQIGDGAFSSVYRARETPTSRPVALKVLKTGGIQPHVVEAFDAEIRALSAVGGHPNIVTLYRPTTTPDGRPILVLELCRRSLAARARAEGPLPVREVVDVGVKIAGALETAHRAGFLHRDVKPQNILETQYGEPALADFGVAMLQASVEDSEGVFGFTTLHAPPEVLEGRPLTPATDVYGLASALYQLLTGRAPFAAYDGEAPAAVILRILRDPVPPVHGPEVPIVLSDLLRRALAKDPAARPGRALDVAEALRSVQTSCGWPRTVAVVLGDAVPAPAPGASTVGPAPSLGTPAPTPVAPATEPVPVPDAPLGPVAPPASGPAPGPPDPATTPSGRGPSVVDPFAGPRRVVQPDTGRRPGPQAVSPPLTPVTPLTGRAQGPGRLVMPPPPPSTPPAHPDPPPGTADPPAATPPGPPPPPSLAPSRPARPAPPGVGPGQAGPSWAPAPAPGRRPSAARGPDGGPAPADPPAPAARPAPQLPADHPPALAARSVPPPALRSPGPNRFEETAIPELGPVPSHPDRGPLGPPAGTPPLTGDRRRLLLVAGATLGALVVVLIALLAAGIV